MVDAWTVAQTVFGAIQAGADVVPPLGRLVRRARERDVELTILPHSLLHERYQYTASSSTELGGIFSAWIRLRLINHSTNRPLRVIGAAVAVKRRRLRFWRKTLFEVPVVTRIGRDDDKPLDLTVPPMGGPLEVDVNTTGWGGHAQLPRYSEAVLVLRLIGPVRRMERPLTAINNPDAR